MRNPLLDQTFLRKLDLTKNKTTYAKIILLTFDEEPIEEIQGKITAGSVNIDGNSAVRRTCSLTMVSPYVDITNTYWALKNKFKLEVGVENNIDSQYPDIIWFKQGTYVFTSLNMSVQSNNFTISLNGKDKMCLLNGEVSGSINASTDFGKLEEYETLDSGEIVRNIIDIPIVDIIKNAVHVYAGQPLHNIIINDVDNYGLELLEYRGDKDLYLPREIRTGEVSNLITNSEQVYYRLKDNGTREMVYVDNKVNEEEGIATIVYYPRTGLNEDKNEANGGPTVLYALAEKPEEEEKEETYNIIKISYGETAGYRRTELTYPGELVANVGESLVSILDKIKNMFSNFEYFYDVDGRFIFQKKKTYINTSFNNLTTTDNQTYAEAAAYTSSTVYSFEDGILLSAFTDNPQILNIKNDFSIWGKRKGITGMDIPVHMRYAIDFKPEYYKTLDGKIFTSEQYDWRELIYQMALDYFKYNHKFDNFTQMVAAENPDYYPTGITGYEMYYTDMQGFWRQLYNPDAINKVIYSYAKIGKIKEEDFSTEYEYYILNSETKQYEVITNYDANLEYYIRGEKPLEYVELDITKGVSTGMFSVKDGWNENVTKYPEVLNFWLDFMSVEGDFQKYTISAIGDRSKAISDDKVNAIYYQETPNILYLTSEEFPNIGNIREDYNDITGYTFIQLNNGMENYFSISSQGKSAKDELDNLLYQHTCATEAVNLTAVPIYYLEPNIRILVNDKNTGINGEYIVSKITIPLQYNGTTSITTTKAVQRIY